MKKLNLQTIAKLASQAGMSVGQYIDYVMNNPDSFDASNLRFYEALDNYFETDERVNRDLKNMRH